MPVFAPRPACRPSAIRISLLLFTAHCALGSRLSAQSTTARTGTTKATPAASVAKPAVPVPARSTSSGASSTSIGLRVGTLGVGLELSHLFGDHIGARIGGNMFSLNRNQTQGDLAYEVKAKLQSFTGLLDWYPARRGAFHISAGAISSPLSLDGVGVPAADGSFKFNRTTYTSSQVGILTATAKYPSVLPYVGIGFGTPASKSHGVGLLLDVGAAIGKSTVQIQSSNAANVPGMQANLNVEQNKAQDTANKIPVWPAVSLGLTYRF
jgi:hypothetical protein